LESNSIISFFILFLPIPLVIWGMSQKRKIEKWRSRQKEYNQREDHQGRKEWDRGENYRRFRREGQNGSHGARSERMVKKEEYFRNILEIQGEITLEEVKRCYKKLVAQYHPDKVCHLGPKLREIAEQEMKNLNEAYEYFKKNI
jgi:hypothetical protein